MVRTFAFNPSTQTSLMGDFADRLPGVKQQTDPNHNFLKSPRLRLSQSHSDYSSEHNYSAARDVHYNPQDLQLKIPHQSQLDVSFNYSVNSDDSQPNDGGMHPPIVEDSTLFAIRSLLINGQRFYQPIDVNLNGLLQNAGQNGLKRHLMAPHNGHHPLRHSASMGEQLSSSPATAALIAMQMARERNAKEQAQRQEDDRRNGYSQGHHSRPESNGARYGRDSSAKEEKEMGEELPWARGNPQPRSGKRGSHGWNAAQKAVPTFHTETHNSYTPTAPQPMNLSNSYGSFYSDLSTHAAFRPGPNLAQFASDPDQRVKLEKEQHNYELQKQIEDNKRRKYLEKQREWEHEERQRIRDEIYVQRQRAEVEAEQRRATEKALQAERKAERIAAAQRATMEIISKEKPTPERQAPNDFASKLSPTNNHQGSDEPELEWWEKKNNWNQRGSSPAVPALRQSKDEQNNNDENFPSNNQQSYEEKPIGRRLDSSASRRSLSNYGNRSPTTNYEVNKRPSEDEYADKYERPRPASRAIRPARARSHSRSSRLSYQSSIEAAHNQPEVRIGSRLENSRAMRNLSATHRELEKENTRIRDAIEKNDYGHHLFD